MSQSLRKTIRLRAHGVLSGVRTEHPHQTHLGKLWNVEHKEKFLKLDKRKDKLPMKEGIMLPSASQALDFCGRVSGLLITRDLEPRILYPAQQATETNNKVETCVAMQELRHRLTSYLRQNLKGKGRRTWDLSKSGLTPKQRGVRVKECGPGPYGSIHIRPESGPPSDVS